MSNKALKLSVSDRGNSRSHLQKRINTRKAKADTGSGIRLLNTYRPSDATVAILIAIVVAAAAAYPFVTDSRLFRTSINSQEVRVGAEVPAFVVVDLPGRGKGLIASKDIKQGELLIKEKPLIVVPSSTSLSPVEVIKDRLNILTRSERDVFYSLSYVMPAKDLNSRNTLSDDDVTLAIFQTNAISAGDNVGLFPQTARMNHGCSAAFNSVYSWRPREGLLVVHALKPINRGQELLTTYTDTKKSRHERQLYLKNYYDFTCSCSVCSLSEAESAVSDERLARMSSLSQAFATWGQRRIDGASASRIAKEIWELGEKEKYWSERGRLAADVAHVAAAHADEKAVSAWAKLAQAWYSIELGSDSIQVLEMQALLNNPRSHFAWATRQPQLVEQPADI